MPAPARTPRSSWIDAGLDVLATDGLDAVRVESLAIRLGVTKGGFYGYFSGRPELLDELLAAWEQRSVTDVLAAVCEINDPAERMRRAGQLTFADDLVPLDLAVRHWARRDPVVAERLARVDNVRMEFLRQGFAAFVGDPAEVEARSTLAFATALGSSLMRVDHGPFGRDDARRLAAEFVLAPPGEVSGGADPVAGADRGGTETR